MAAQPLRPLAAKSFDYWSALHLANRAGFGATPIQVRALHSLGVAKAVESLVECDRVPTSEEGAWDGTIIHPETDEERQIARQARQNKDEETLARLQKMRQDRDKADREQLAEMQKWWLRRMIESSRPLEEKMTLFWHGHFASSHRTVQDSWHLAMQNRLFRRDALGNFGDLVQGIIRDPAMLQYLDNDENRRRRPNENLARELMELFTLGEGRGYTENDIKEGARALTGYTYDDDAFVFRENEHDPDEKSIFGRRGTFDGDDFVDMILAKKETSEFLSWKLYRFFVHDSPGGPTALSDEQKEVVAGLAKELRASKYDLKPVLTTLFRSEHFYAQANRAAVIKSPIQLIVQTIRSYHTPTRSLSALVNAADLMGQALFQPPNVKGWDGGRAWINTATMFVRQNVAIYLLTGRKPDVYDWQSDEERFDATDLIAELREASGGAPGAAEVAEFLLRFSLAAAPRPERIETLTRFLTEAKDAPENDRILGALCLITALPEYQLC